MRVLAWMLIASVLPAASVQAQKTVPHVIPSVPAPRDPLPRFTIAPRGGVLGPVGLPLPKIGLPPLETPRHGRHRTRYATRYPVYSWPWPVFYVAEPEKPAAPQPSEPRPESPAAPGRLVVEIEPGAAEIFADGYYIGTGEDFSGARGGGLLTAGPHRIDVSASGFESLTRVINVTPGQSVTVRGSLKVLPPPAAVPRTTFYLIPGCYMGNIPPQDAQLPSTCDKNRATTWIP
jgi:hypothetical protein